MAGLIGRLRDRDVVTVTVSEWPAATPRVRFTYLSGWRRAITPVGIVISLGLGAWAIFGGIWQLTMFPALLLVQFIALRETSFDWIDRTMGPTVLRAAQELGTSAGPREWTVAGGHAHDLAAEVRAWMFYNRPDSAQDADLSPMERERKQIATAGPILRRHLRPVLTAAEHGNEPLGLSDQTAPLAPGDPWPVIESGAQKWDQPQQRPDRT